MEALSHSLTATSNFTPSSLSSISSSLKKFTNFTNSSFPKIISQPNIKDPLSVSSSLPRKLVFYRIPLTKIGAFSPSSSTTSCSTTNANWVVLMNKPPDGVESKEEIMNYYVSTLQRALGSEQDAKSCIYKAFHDTHFGFCCNIDEETSQILARFPGVISVKSDPETNNLGKNDSGFNFQGNLGSKSPNGSTLLFSEGLKHWLVRVEKPSGGVSSKPNAVDFYVNMLTKVLGNEKDAQMCLYHVSWKYDFGFCCALDEESVQELAAVPGVLSVQPDEHFESVNKDYGGGKLFSDTPDHTQTTGLSKTKLFITGLSFYTSEKTLRAAFEPFGELAEVKVIMDKISKRSKGYAFVDYATEEAATTALNEMNGKIINGWMIVVDRAKSNPRYDRGGPRSTSSRYR